MNKLEDSSRRRFIKKVGYIAPVVLTLTATPILASAGSLQPLPPPPTDLPPPPPPV